jgi:hypothetical protein
MLLKRQTVVLLIKKLGSFRYLHFLAAVVVVRVEKGVHNGTLILE